MSYSAALGQISGCVEADHGVRLSAMVGMGALVIVEGDPVADACRGP